MPCPVVNYGVPDSGATEYNINSGREMFRCGPTCVRLFIVNVSLEKSLVKYNCADISDAVAGDTCMQSANASWRDQSVVNWIAKEGVDSSLPNGFVITKAGVCAGTLSIYTHSEGSMNARVLANVESLKDNADQIKQNGLSKLLAVSTFADGSDGVSNMDWILSDLSINVSPTDWQGGSVTYQGFGVLAGGSTRTYRVNFNWANGRSEESLGRAFYDTSDTPDRLESIVTELLVQ